MKKIFWVILLFFLTMLSFGQAQAAGLVPCGGAGEPACSLGCFFQMIDNVLDFVLIRIVPVVAVLMLAIGGAMFLFAGANPGMLETGKKIITSTIWGLVIIFAAFLVVGIILSAIGLADWTQDIYKNWWDKGFFQIPGC